MYSLYDKTTIFDNHHNKIIRKQKERTPIIKKADKLLPEIVGSMFERTDVFISFPLEYAKYYLVQMQRFEHKTGRSIKRKRTYKKNAFHHRQYLLPLFQSLNIQQLLSEEGNSFQQQQ